MLYIFIQYQSGPEHLRLYEITGPFMGHLGLIFGFLSELLRSGEMNQLNLVSHSRLIIEGFIYRGVYYFTKPSKRTA